jgi:DNA-binding beta-propeller fold protein YncE
MFTLSESAVAAGSFQAWRSLLPEGIAVTSRGVVVADRGSVTLQPLASTPDAPAPRALLAWPELTHPVDVAVRGEELLCLDRFRLQVVSVRPGEPPRDLLRDGPRMLRDPEALEALPDGSLAVLDAGANEVLVFGRAGRFDRRIGGFGTGSHGMKCPHDLALGGDGVLYVADAGNRRIQRYRIDGECLGGWGSFGDGPTQFRDPTGVALLPDGNLLVADHYGHRLQVLDTRTGEELVERRVDLTKIPGTYRYPTRVAARSDGQCFVTSAQLGEVWELTCP